MAEAKLFRSGLPYAPDVKRLRELFPATALTEGSVIPHEQLEGVIGELRYTARYYGVVNCWIKLERNENGIFMAWEPSRGVKVLNPAELLQHAETRTRQKINQTGKAIRLFGWVDRNRLDDIGKKRLDHQARIAAVIRDSLQSAKKELAVDLAPIQSLPKPKLEAQENGSKRT